MEGILQGNGSDEALVSLERFPFNKGKAPYSEYKRRTLSD